MKKLFTVTIFLFALCASMNAVSIAETSRIYSIKLKSYFDVPLSVTALDLSKTEISANCLETNKNCSNEKIIEVQAIAADSGDRNDIKYVYKVSGGKVIGEGANVKWDLSGVKPGNYIITAAVSQFSFDRKRLESYGMTQTKVVVVKE